MQFLSADCMLPSYGKVWYYMDREQPSSVSFFTLCWLLWIILGGFELFLNRSLQKIPLICHLNRPAVFHHCCQLCDFSHFLGLCLRLYSQSLYEEGMAEAHCPGVMEENLSHLVLLLKRLDIADMGQCKFLDRPGDFLQTSSVPQSTQ